MDIEEGTPRIEFTDIQVRENGKWYTKNIPIQNKKILEYFKKNLHRDEKGIYIFNTFGQFSEKGYIKANGPILKVTDIKKDAFTLETGEEIKKIEAKILLGHKMTPFLEVPRLKTWAVFSRELSDILGDIIEISGDKYIWRGEEIPVVETVEWG